MGTYREVVLWGDEHTELGEIAVVGLAPDAAVALSRGKFPKGYPHVDPNEDAVLAATDGSNWLLAVADGHNGFDAARAALNAIRMGTEATLSVAVADPVSALRDALTSAKSAVSDALTDLEGHRTASATAVTLAAVAGGRLTTLTMGDTAAVLIRNGRGRRIGRPTKFLDSVSDISTADFATAEWQLGDQVVVASDGLFDFVGRSPNRVLARLVAQHPDNPADLANAAVESAFDGGAGDNIAVAALYDAGR
jgi:serine/threonine protein phosphatase PrpC